MAVGGFPSNPNVWQQLFPGIDNPLEEIEIQFCQRIGEIHNTQTASDHFERNYREVSVLGLTNRSSHFCFSSLLQWGKWVQFLFTNNTGPRPCSKVSKNRRLVEGKGGKRSRKTGAPSSEDAFVPSGLDGPSYEVLGILPSDVSVVQVFSPRYNVPDAQGGSYPVKRGDSYVPLVSQHISHYLRVMCFPVTSPGCRPVLRVYSMYSPVTVPMSLHNPGDELCLPIDVPDCCMVDAQNQVMDSPAPVRGHRSLPVTRRQPRHAPALAVAGLADLVEKEHPGYVFSMLMLFKMSKFKCSLFLSS